MVYKFFALILNYLFRQIVNIPPKTMAGFSSKLAGINAQVADSASKAAANAAGGAAGITVDQEVCFLENNNPCVPYFNLY